VQDILSDEEVRAVIITTRHNQHADQVIAALKAGKHVFVEKPLALTYEELESVVAAYEVANSSVTVGFNRRFSPFIQHAKKAMGSSSTPINVIATMNAGSIPADHWVQDMEVGGGRIIGEACHYIDLVSFITGSKVKEVIMNAQGTAPDVSTDNASIILKYENGSQGVINYFSDGNKAYSKERVEIYDNGKNIIIDNFRSSTYFGYGSKGIKKTQDKGHAEQFRRWNEMITKGGDPIIPFSEIENTTKAAIACIDSLKSRSWVMV